MLHPLHDFALPQPDKAHVQAPLEHISDQQFALGREPAHIHIRITTVEHRQQVDQVQRGERADFTNRQPPAHLAAGRRHVIGNAPGRLHRWPCTEHKRFSRRCQAYPSRTTFEQAHPQLRLQPRHLMAKGRLHHMAALRRAGKTAGVGHGKGIFELLEVHRSICFQDE